MKVYAFMYNPMIEESAYATMSLHKTRKGAEMALDFHKVTKIKEWRELYPTSKDEPCKINRFQDWIIKEVEILP